MVFGQRIVKTSAVWFAALKIKLLVLTGNSFGVFGAANCGNNGWLGWYELQCKLGMPLTVLSKMLWSCLLKGKVCCFTMGIFVVNLLCKLRPVWICVADSIFMIGELFYLLNELPGKWCSERIWFKCQRKREVSVLSSWIWEIIAGNFLLVCELH